MGRTDSRLNFGSGSIFGSSCWPTMLRSICSRVVDPRSGSNPLPVILTQPASFNMRRVSLALMHVKSAPISASVSFFAKLFSTSSKSRDILPPSSPSSRDDTIALLVVDGCRCQLLFSQDEDGVVIDVANNARDGGDKYLATFTSSASGKSHIYKPATEGAAVLLRLLDSEDVAIITTGPAHRHLASVWRTLEYLREITK